MKQEVTESEEMSEETQKTVDTILTSADDIDQDAGASDDAEEQHVNDVEAVEVDDEAATVKEELSKVSW